MISDDGDEEESTGECVDEVEVLSNPWAKFGVELFEGLVVKFLVFPEGFLNRSPASWLSLAFDLYSVVDLDDVFSVLIWLCEYDLRGTRFGDFCDDDEDLFEWSLFGGWNWPLSP